MVEAVGAEQPRSFHIDTQEYPMSKSIQFLAMVGLVATVAACDNSRKEEFVVVQPEPISVEPAFTGKLK